MDSILEVIQVNLTKTKQDHVFHHLWGVKLSLIGLKIRPQSKKTGFIFFIQKEKGSSFNLLI